MSKIVGVAPRKHRCREELPRRRWWKRFPDGIQEGTIVECSCGIQYVWSYWGYSETWSWTEYKGGSV